MYKVKTDNKQEVLTQANKSVLTSTGLIGVNSVRIPSARSSSSKNSILSNTKIHSEVVEVYAKKNKKTNVTSRMNVVKTKKHVANIDTKNALKAKIDILALFTTPRTAISKSVDTTSVVVKTVGSFKS
ncbi:hypothetical protein Tco_1288667 [Tanacetum coccineum]